MSRQDFYPSDPSETESSEWAKRQPVDGSFQVAGPAGWFARREMQKHPEIEHQLRGTIRGMFGNAFTDQEITKLQDRALDAAEMKDILIFQGIQGGSTVTITPAQKSRIDQLMGKLGDDDLGRRARGAYGRAVSEGRIRVH